MRIDDQITLGDISREYAEFVEKFKPKKTTDDCYTPANVYETVLEWVVAEYAIDREKVIRPFWPGGDYLREDYPEGWVVVDNPPFSILSRICKDYVRAGVRFFLFAPYLTNLSTRAHGICHIITEASIIYENGAEVNTTFLTNLDRYEIRTAPDLNAALIKADAVNRREIKRQLPKYEYPANILTATMCGRFSKYGIDFRLERKDGEFIRALDEQKAANGKGIFGGGYLISEKAAAEKAAAEKAAAEKAAAEKWHLSKRELAIVAGLGGAS